MTAPAVDPGLREEVRELVVARNRRREVQGEAPLDVERSSSASCASSVPDGVAIRPPRRPDSCPPMDRPMAFPRPRILFALLLIILTGALVAPAASHAATGQGTSATAAKKHSARSPQGRSRPQGVAREAPSRAPGKRLARFLAKQVGPKAIKRAKARRPRLRRVIQDFLPAAKPGALRLVRSFDVPADDPAAARMANLSWTYDSALASISMMFAGEKAQAEQLLDQLAALQRTDGSIDFAFNVADGSSLQQFRTGSIAWIGLAAATYGNLYRSTR